MTDKNDDEYYVASLVSEATEEHDVELSQEEREQVAELQEIYRDVDLQDWTPEKYDVETMPDDLRREYEIAIAEFIRREGEMTEDDYSELEQFYGLDEGDVAELKRGGGDE